MDYGFTNLRVIGHMYKFCLLTALLEYAILRLGLPGAAPADQQPALKAGWAGKPETACNPVASVAYRMGPSAAAP